MSYLPPGRSITCVYPRFRSVKNDGSLLDFIISTLFSGQFGLSRPVSRPKPPRIESPGAVWSWMVQGLAGRVVYILGSHSRILIPLGYRDRMRRHLESRIRSLPTILEFLANLPHSLDSDSSFPQPQIAR